MTQVGYLRFFGGAHVDGVDVYVNDMLMVGQLAFGAFSSFRRGAAGVFKIDLRLSGGESDVNFSEMVSIMADTAYTIAITGSTTDLNIVIIPLDLRVDLHLPSLRFANIVADGRHGAVDIAIDGHDVARALMFGEASDNMQIMPGTYHAAAYNENAQRIAETTLKIEGATSYIAIVAGGGIFMADDSPTQ